MNKIASMLTVLLLIVMNLQSQTHRIEYFYCVDDPPLHKELYKVVFKDLRTYEAAKIINLEQGNPFAQPCLEYRTTYEPGMIRSYNNNGCVLSDLVPANIIKRQKIEQFAGKVPVRASVQIFPLKGENEFAYYTNLYVKLNYDALIAIYSKFYLYNSDGTLRCKIEDSDVELTDAYLTPGGRYLMHRFGDFRFDSENNVPGFRIIDLDKGKQYMEMIVQANNQFWNRMIDSTTFLGVCKNVSADGKLINTVHIFDLKKNKCYIKDYPAETLLKNYRHDCVEVDGNRTDYYEKDYRGEDLLWKAWNMDAGQ